MNAFHSAGSDRTDIQSTNAAVDPEWQADGEPAESDTLPACFLFAIIAGFAAFVAFNEAILPSLLAAAAGAAFGLLLASERWPSRHGSQNGKRIRM